jgi:3-isopropylmalate/(R)-2-methylmalate dehydratase small subunit
MPPGGARPASGGPDVSAYVRKRIQGRIIPLPGNDIDTDRIIPARYLKAVTFAGLGDHVFEDDREQNRQHPFDDPRYRGAALLVVGLNFGCGSSREHAPQALQGWGIRAIVGGSFAEIFFGNCTALGIPCVTADTADIEWLMAEAARAPQTEGTVDLESRIVRFGERTILVGIPEGARGQLVAGAWNATGVLLEAGDAIEEVAKRLPYIDWSAETGLDAPPGSPARRPASRT